MSHSHMPPILRSHVHDPFTMDIWDPFSDRNNEHHRLRPPHIPLIQNSILNKRAEWQETPDAHVLRTEIPAGLNKDDVKVRIEDNMVLKISGKKEAEKEEVHENWQHFERSKGRFSQVVSLPENSRLDHVRYTLENGILIVTVPKRDVSRSQAKTIHVHD